MSEQLIRSIDVWGGGERIRTIMYLRGEHGVLQFRWTIYGNQPAMPTDVGYHWPKPRYEGQKLQDEACEVLGGPCYYDGSSLWAEEMYALLQKEGTEAVWKRLEKQYFDMVAEDAKGNP